MHLRIVELATCGSPGSSLATVPPKDPEFSALLRFFATVTCTLDSFHPANNLTNIKNNLFKKKTISRDSNPGHSAFRLKGFNH